MAKLKFDIVDYHNVKILEKQRASFLTLLRHIVGSTVNQL